MGISVLTVFGKVQVCVYVSGKKEGGGVLYNVIHAYTDMASESLLDVL